MRIVADENIPFVREAFGRIGEVVTAKGVVRTNKDFGSGYSYKVLVEEATLQR